MKVLDLFSGIGGFSLGLERAGFETVAFCEIAKFQQAILKKNFPNIPIYEDITKLDFNEPIDLICGGFPCQDISVAGKGAGLAGSRSGLWREYARIISETQPRFIIIENVGALLSRGLHQVLQDLAKIGYDAEWDIIPAAAVGANHRRERVYILAYYRGERVEGFFQEEIYRQPAFSWSKDVRGIEDLPNRCDLYESKLCRSPNGISKRLDAIGNAVVPQIPELIGRAIKSCFE